MKITRITRILLALALTLVLTASAGIIAFADAGDQDDPYIGGHDYGDEAGGSIILHKLDIAQFEHNKAQELITAGTLSDGGTVTYTGNAATGEELTSGSEVGYYTTTDDPDTHMPVTLGELAPLSDIIFQLEQVELASGASPGSTTPTDYQPIADPIANDYAKTAVDTGLISWTGLPNGYYRITELSNDTGAPVGSGTYIIALPMIDPTGDGIETINIVHMYPKNRADLGPDIEKEPPTLDDQNGNIVTWTIKAEIPKNLEPAASADLQSYVISDTLGEGLEFIMPSTLKVFYYGTDDTKVNLDSSADYAAAIPGANNETFTITLQSAGFDTLTSAMAANEIRQEADGRYLLFVTYDSVVDLTPEQLQAATDPTNKVHLDFTNHEGHLYEKDPPPTELDHYAGIRLTKMDGANKNIKLQGVTFKVYTALTSESPVTVDETSALKDETGAEITFTTDENGEFFYGGLDAGNYYAVELAPLAGYKQMTEVIVFPVTEEDVEYHTVVEMDAYNYFDNGFTLPRTGGSGTLLYIIGGIVLIAAAAIIFVVSRRRARTRDEG